MIFFRYIWVFLMKSCSELLDIYRNLAKMIETQFLRHIKVFRSDNALEYTQHTFQDILLTLWHCSLLVISGYLTSKQEC